MHVVAAPGLRYTFGGALLEIVRYVSLRGQHESATRRAIQQDLEEVVVPVDACRDDLDTFVSLANDCLLLGSVGASTHQRLHFLNHERSPYLNTADSTKLPLNSRRVVRESQSLGDAPRWSRIRPLVAKALVRRDASGMVRGAHFPDFDGAAGNKTRRNSDLPTQTPASSCAVPCACAAHVNHEALSVIHRGNWPTDSLAHSRV